MKIQCDVCEKVEAEVLCCADEAVLCRGCDHKVHAANKLSQKHERVLLLKDTSSSSSSSSTSSSTSSSSHAQLPPCDICKVCHQHSQFLCHPNEKCYTHPKKKNLSKLVLKECVTISSHDTS